MNCKDCYWCKSNSALNNEKVCCNVVSNNYNKIFSKQEIEHIGCDDGEAKQTVDYKNMTAWEFISKYYM